MEVPFFFPQENDVHAMISIKEILIGRPCF